MHAKGHHRRRDWPVKGRILILLAAIVLAGCSTTGTPAAQVRLAAGSPGCGKFVFNKKTLRFQCDDIAYDLLGSPERIRRIFDIVSREAFTRSHYIVKSQGKRYAFRTERMEGEHFPWKIILETRRGFVRVVLDPRGNVVHTSWMKEPRPG